jgi:hypothetical protein
VWASCIMLEPLCVGLMHDAGGLEPSLKTVKSGFKSCCQPTSWDVIVFPAPGTQAINVQSGGAAVELGFLQSWVSSSGSTAGCERQHGQSLHLYARSSMMHILYTPSIREATGRWNGAGEGSIQGDEMPDSWSTGFTSLGCHL